MFSDGCLLCFPSRIADLKVAAQKSFSQSFLRLVAPDGHLLDQKQSLEDAGLQEGEAWRLAFLNLKELAGGIAVGLHPF